MSFLAMDHVESRAEERTKAREGVRGRNNFTVASEEVGGS
jgi:hypothetical protein